METAELPAVKSVEVATAPIESELGQRNPQQGFTSADFSPAAMAMNPVIFEHMQRVAKMYAASQWVPDHYKGKVADCAVAVSMACTLNVNPVVFLQRTYPVHGRIGFEGQLAIALINVKGGFKHRLMFDVEGEGDDLKVTAWTTMQDGSILRTGYSMALANKTMVFEKGGQIPLSKKSSWQGDREQKCCYMAALVFARRYCPEVLMGMSSDDELSIKQPASVSPSGYTELLDARKD